MAVRRTVGSSWAVFGLVAIIAVAGCEGSSSNDAVHGKGGNGGATSGTGGFSGDAGRGSGGTSTTGGSAAGGTNATGGTGGDAGAGPGGDAGTGDTGPGGGSSGDAGAGGSNEDPTVRGRVIDYWRAPVPGTIVTIGTSTVTTDSNGAFTIPDVAPEYDVSFVVHWTIGREEIYGWRYEGLTRRDPTLQVYRGRGVRDGNIAITPQGAVLGSSGTLSIAIAGADGSFNYDDASTVGLSTSIGWVGPATMPASAHALLWDVDSNSLPTGYRSYDTAPMTLSESGTATFSPSLANETIATGTLAGMITRESTPDNANLLFVRFTSGAAIQVVSDSSGTDSYGYTFPLLPSSSITVAASTGYWAFGEYAVAHRDGLSSSNSSVAISVPTPPTQVAPQGGMTGVTSSTRFSWQAGTARTFVVTVEDRSFYQGVNVVTNRTQTTLPSFPDGGFSLRANGVHTWRVETHGDATTVDELAGPNGFFDSMSGDVDNVTGPRTGDGSFTGSTPRNFTTAP